MICVIDCFYSDQTETILDQKEPFVLVIGIQDSYELKYNLYNIRTRVRPN